MAIGEHVTAGAVGSRGYMVAVGWKLHSAPIASLPDPSVFVRWAPPCRWRRAAAGPGTWRVDDLHAQPPGALMATACPPSGALAAGGPAPAAAQAGARRLDELHAQQPAELPLVHSLPPSVASNGPRGAPPRRTARRGPRGAPPQ